jgi:hypothetical protein
MRLSPKGNAVTMEISFWLNAQDNSIRMSAPGFSELFPPVKVSDKPESRHGHPALFARLAKCLAESGAPAPPTKENHDASRS